MCSLEPDDAAVLQIQHVDERGLEALARLDGRAVERTRHDHGVVVHEEPFQFQGERIPILGQRPERAFQHLLGTAIRSPVDPPLGFDPLDLLVHRGQHFLDGLPTERVVGVRNRLEVRLTGRTHELHLVFVSSIPWFSPWPRG